MDEKLNRKVLITCRNLYPDEIKTILRAVSDIFTVECVTISGRLHHERDYFFPYPSNRLNPGSRSFHPLRGDGLEGGNK